MKQILFVCMLYLQLSIVSAQITPTCPSDALGAEINGTDHLDFTPTLHTADVWGTPTLMTDRRVFFVHGLGGEGDDDGTTSISWMQASLWSEQQYMINSARPDYNNVSLEAAAMELKGDLESFADADETSIVIAHSQGGIVSRRVDKMYTTGEFGFEPRTFGGLVTFGTPHQGAKILNNVEDLQAWIGDACEALSAGPVAETVESSFFLDLFLDPVDYEAFTEEFCASIENEILPIVMDDYLAGTTSAYAEGAPYLATLNTFVPEIPYVCFYGVETEPVFWHTLVHLFPGREPNNTITYGESPFGATDDETAVAFGNAMIDKYYGKYTSYNSLYEEYNDLLTGFDMATISCYLSLICAAEAIISRDEAEVIRDAYEQGYDWLMNANTSWEGFIGMRELVEDGTTCTCIDWGPLGDLEEDIYEAAPDGSCATEDDDTNCYSTTNYVWQTRDSDGIVVRSSASECLGQLSEGMVFTQMPGSNHFSIRNDANTKTKLIHLYDGVHGSFYKTNPR